MTLLRFFFTMGLLIIVDIPATFASIQISTTRVIYHEEEKTVSVQITNPGKHPVLLQSWIDNGNPDIKPDSVRTPFILTPPLARVNAEKGQSLRLSYIGSSLPTDKESLYWLNVLEIPPLGEKDNNQIQVAFRSRIKLFYRPVTLDDKGALLAISSLRWHVTGDDITLENPTPYYVSVLSITIEHGGKKTSVPTDMLPPKSRTLVRVPRNITLNATDNVVVEAINDYGSAITVPISRA